MILGADSRKPYSDIDTLLLAAYEVLESERCDQCGMYKWLCHSTDTRLNVRVIEDECMVKVAVAEFDEKRKGKDDEVSPPMGRPEFYARDDTPLHKFRDVYYQQLEDEREADATD